jgi:SpoIID/LytB domain protein
MTRPELGRLTPRTVISVALAVIVVVGGLVVPTARVAADTPVADTILVTGRGWGHGRGLGQWGAFGYATGRSGGPWGYRTILDHFYGDTVMASVDNPLAAVTLLDQRGKALVVERSNGVSVDGLSGESVAVRATLRPDGRFDVQRATACIGAEWGAPSVVDGPVRFRAPRTSGAASDVLRLCRSDGSRAGYRGELVAFGRTFDGADRGLAQTVNLVRLDDLVRGIVPLLVPAAWASIDGERGRQALLAQAVASRGFAAVGDPRWHDLHTGIGAQFSTCDTAVCQPYRGVGGEQPETNEVVTSTSGEVRARGGVVLRTEYTASTGGWTAGGEFPPVFDQGDAVTDNPNRRWSASISRVAIEARYAVGELQAITVVERNGLGADGGRVLGLRLVGTAASVDITGQRFRDDFGLRSDWFTLSGVPPRPPVAPRSIAAACPEASVPDATFTDVATDSVHRQAIECMAWWGVTTGSTATTYRPAGLVTRGQMASFLARLLEAVGATLPSDPPDAFVDDDGSRHEAAIDSLAAIGIVRGVAADRFEPEALVDRAQAAALVVRLLRHLDVPLDASPPDAFADDQGSVHQDSINQVAAEGIVTGVSAGFVQPDGPNRRDRMASLLARTLALVVERTGTALPP